MILALTYYLLIVFSLHSFSGVENSFPNAIELIKFYQKWYEILLHKQYPMKESKLILVGPPDSGKTSWFAPFEGIFSQHFVNEPIKKI